MISSIALLVSIFIPTALAVVFVSAYIWWVKRDKRRSPLSGKLHHSAGEQVRARIQEHGDEMLFAWMTMSLTAPMLMLAWSLRFVPWRQLHFGVSDALYLLVAAAFFAVGLRRFLRHAG
jgi:uncharacterized ion transporter superfamily protein YfcC